MMDVDSGDGKYKDINTCVKAFTTFEERKDIAVEKISLSETNKTMEVGDKATLNVTITPSNAANKNIKWTSSDEKVVSVSEKGVVTAIKEGTATITAESEDGNKIATCKITVKSKTNNDDDGYKAEDSKGNSTDISGKDEKDKINNKNTNTNKSDTNKNTKNDTKTNTQPAQVNKDSTLAKKIIPYAGRTKIVISIIAVLTLGVIIFIKYKSMRDVK